MFASFISTTAPCLCIFCVLQSCFATESLESELEQEQIIKKHHFIELTEAFHSLSSTEKMQTVDENLKNLRVTINPSCNDVHSHINLLSTTICSILNESTSSLSNLQSSDFTQMMRAVHAAYDTIKLFRARRRQHLLQFCPDEDYRELKTFYGSWSLNAIDAIIRYTENHLNMQIQPNTLSYNNVSNQSETDLEEHGHDKLNTTISMRTNKVKLQITRHFFERIIHDFVIQKWDDRESQILIQKLLVKMLENHICIPKQISVFCYCVKHEYPKFVDFLINIGKANDNEYECGNNQTALMMAASNGYLEIVQSLLAPEKISDNVIAVPWGKYFASKDNYVNYQTASGSSALSLALQFPKVVECLLAHGANFSVEETWYIFGINKEVLEQFTGDVVLNSTLKIIGPITPIDKVLMLCLINDQGKKYLDAYIETIKLLVEYGAKSRMDVEYSKFVLSDQKKCLNALRIVDQYLTEAAFHGAPQREYVETSEVTDNESDTSTILEHEILF